MSKLIPIISIYILSVSTLYMLGYWNQFNINFLEYTKINEMALISLKSIILTFGSSLVGVVFSRIFFRNTFSHGGGKNSTESKFLNKWWKIFSFIILFPLLYMYYKGMPIFLVTYLSIILGIWLSNKDILEEQFGDFFTIEDRSSIIFVSIFILLFSYSLGEKDALNIKHPFYPNVKVNIDNVEYSYIGKLGNSIFVYDDKNTTIQITPIPKKIVYFESEIRIKMNKVDEEK